MTEENQGTRVIAWDVNRAAIAAVKEELKDIDAHKDLDGAKKAKKKLTGMRTDLTAYHKETKAEALAFGNQCDAEKNALMALIKEIEDPISDDLDKIKNAAALAEEERVGKIMSYIEGIQAFALDRHDLTLEELIARRDELQSRGLDPEITQEMHEDAQLSFDEADLKLRLAIDRERTRLDEEEKAAAVEAENKELREKLAKAEAEQEERDRVAREEQEEKDRKAQAIIDEENAEKQAEFDRVAKEQEDERQRLDQERKDREQEEADKKAEEDRIEAERQADELAEMQAPDIVKLEKYAAALDHLIGLKPVMGTTNGNVVLLSAVGRMIEAHRELTTDIEELK